MSVTKKHLYEATSLIIHELCLESYKFGFLGVKLKRTQISSKFHTFSVTKTHL